MGPSIPNQQRKLLLPRQLLNCSGENNGLSATSLLQATGKNNALSLKFYTVQSNILTFWLQFNT